uniref:Uncharacterized protein n=1 Tax=Myotis myotis TaxID=51298 RepID=A0A7J7XHS5_MYOMY|nr:hypothetical protein mMyoMyo1_011777 [Myotis myotis]
MSRPKGWLGMGYEGGGREQPPQHPPGIPGISESDRQPLHTTPPWLPPHSGGSLLLSQVVEAPSPHPSSSSGLSPLPSLNLGFPDHYYPRTFVPAMPSGDSLAQCKVCPQRGPSYSPCSHYLGIIQMEWIVRLKKLRTSSLLGLVVPQLPVRGLPGVQRTQSVKGEHCLGLVVPQLPVRGLPGVQRTQSVKGEHCLAVFAVAISGLGLCN